jgi:hypothetical protein
MSLTAHVHQTYIAATPEHVWAAITESEWTRRYFHMASFVESPQQGRRYLTVRVDGRPAVDGVIEEMQRPAAGRPGLPCWKRDVRYLGLATTRASPKPSAPDSQTETRPEPAEAPFESSGATT